MASFRWLWFDYSDPRLPISRRQRAELWARMMVRAQHTRPFHLFPVFIAVVGGPWVAAVTGSLLAFTGCGVVAWITSAWIGRWTYRLPLRMAQRDLDLESCDHCGYWFKGMTPSQRHCPECGRPIVGVSPFQKPSRPFGAVARRIATARSRHESGGPAGSSGALASAARRAGWPNHSRRPSS